LKSITAGRGGCREFVDVVFGFDEGFFFQDFTATVDGGFHRFNQLVGSNTVGDGLHNPVPLQLVHHFGDTAVGHHNDLMLEKGNEEHNTRAVTGVEDLFLQECVFRTLPGGMLKL